MCAGLLVITVIAQEVLYHSFWAVVAQKKVTKKLNATAGSPSTNGPLVTPHVTPTLSPRQSIDAPLPLPVIHTATADIVEVTR